MTLDEAIKAVTTVWESAPDKPTQIVKTLVVLGLIKLDEPISPEGRLTRALGHPVGERFQYELRKALERTGLQITEK